MALFVIVRDEGGVVRVETRPTPLKDVAITGKKIIDVIRDAGSALNPVSVAQKESVLGAAALDAERSRRLSADETAQFRAAVLAFDPLLDSVKEETVPGEFDRTHPIHQLPDDNTQRPVLPPLVVVIDP